MDDRMSLKERGKVWFAVVKSVTRMMFGNQTILTSPGTIQASPSMMRAPSFEPHVIPELDDEEVDDYAEDMLSSMSVITIVYDPETMGYPKVDLGDTSPVFAVSMLRKAALAMEMTFPFPQIVYNEDVLFDPSML